MTGAAGRIKEVSAGGIVVRNHEGELDVLLIKDSYGCWTWPKGHPEVGEDLRETALREVTEETGLRDLRLLGKAGTVAYSYKMNGASLDKSVHLYLFAHASDEPLDFQRDEIDDAKWFSLSAALQRLDYRGAKAFLKKTVEKHEKRLFR